MDKENIHKTVYKFIESYLKKVCEDNRQNNLSYQFHDLDNKDVVTFSFKPGIGDGVQSKNIVDEFQFHGAKVDVKTDDVDFTPPLITVKIFEEGNVVTAENANKQEVIAIEAINAAVNAKGITERERL